VVEVLVFLVLDLLAGLYERFGSSPAASSAYLLSRLQSTSVSATSLYASPRLASRDEK
jgi:hypothetical protein